MNNLFIIFAAGISLLPTVVVRAQDYQPEFYVHQQDTLPFRILYPKNFHQDQPERYPLIFFLHGAGERGTDNEAQLKWGASLFAEDSNQTRYPAVVVFPQCPKDSYWSNVRQEKSADTAFLKFPANGRPTRALEAALGLFDSLRQLLYIDSARVYVAGLSMGGMGTLEMMRRRPEAIAAAIAICGGDAPQHAVAYRHIPLWLFHGALDDVVPVSLSRQLAAALKRLNAPVRYTEYPQTNHLSWIPAFQEPELLPWLFQQRNTD